MLAVAVRETLELLELHLLYVANSGVGSMKGNLAMNTSPTKPVWHEYHNVNINKW